MLASDDRNAEFTGARNPDDVLHVTFFVRAVQDNFRSEKEGHPIFRDENWVRIMIPGRNDTVIEEPVEPRHQQRFPRQWMHFKNMTADVEQVIGTPVTEWPALTRAQAEELKAKKFYTVEQVAACSDGQIQALGMNANHLRLKARAFLEAASGTAAAQAAAAEIARKDEEISALHAAQAAQAAQIAELTALVKGGGKAGKKTQKAKRQSNLTQEQRDAIGARLKAARDAKKQPPQAEAS